LPDPKPTGWTKRAREWLAGEGWESAIGTDLETDLVALLEESSNEARWQDLWQAAHDLVNAWADTAEKEIPKRKALRDALEALGTSEPRRESAKENGG
jgi:hypothetical protein